MKLLVVDKLLTGFDAPSCTYLYIDKPMQDHGLFQAICRTNRLDGDDKDFGYIVDYKDLFRKVEKALAVYTSELAHVGGEAELSRYLKLREIIRKASGETIDLKAYEADMRHLIDTYIEADEPKKLSMFDPTCWCHQVRALGDTEMREIGKFEKVIQDRPAGTFTISISSKTP